MINFFVSLSFSLSLSSWLSIYCVTLLYDDDSGLNLWLSWWWWQSNRIIDWKLNNRQTEVQGLNKRKKNPWKHIHIVVWPIVVLYCIVTRYNYLVTRTIYYGSLWITHTKTRTHYIRRVESLFPPTTTSSTPFLIWCTYVLIHRHLQ